MFFNSYLFILVFFPIVLIGYYSINRTGKYRLSEFFLLLMSAVFYGSFEIKSIPVIAGSILVNYAMGRILEHRQSKVWLAAGILFNVLLLGVFKYLNFVLENISGLIGGRVTLVEMIVPIGISFMTFQQISYIVDVYRNRNYGYSLMEYALYVSFFPYVISGPIVRHNELIPQLRDSGRKAFNAENFAKGLYAFILGLGKKVLIADTFAAVANAGFNNVGSLNTTSALFAVLSYSLQIYFDFSGYSDMVLGIGKMLNLDMPINFNSPYKAANILDFWKRWHISLTRFLTEYIYFPLGGNRKGTVRTYINVMCVFAVSGIWHGASWTFVIWGLLHGAASVITRMFRTKIEKMNQTACWILFFAFINFTWIFFRAATLSDAFTVIKTIVKCQFGLPPAEMTTAVLLPEIEMVLDLLGAVHPALAAMILPAAAVTVTICVLVMRNTQEKLETFKPTAAKSLLCAVLLVWCVVSFSGVTSFIYVNF